MIEEVKRLFAQADVKLTCQAQLKLLSNEDHPGRPLNPILDVVRLEHHATDWYRLKIVRHNVRIVFSLAYLNGNEFIEYQFRDVPFEEAENYLLVQFADYRSDETYIEVRRRWQRSRR